MKTLKFMISDKQYIQVTSDAIFEKGCCLACIECDLDYVDEEKGQLIRFGYEQVNYIYGGFGRMDFVKNLIENKMILDKKITPDLGFEWNQFYQGLIKDTDILEKYHFVSNAHKQIRPYYNSWFYNDEDGNIVFEITPFYPFHYETKKSHPDFITYKQFMKSYKPIVKIIIPKERFIEWNEQAKLADPKCFNDE